MANKKELPAVNLICSELMRIELEVLTKDPEKSTIGLTDSLEQLARQCDKLSKSILNYRNQVSLMMERTSRLDELRKKEIQEGKYSD